MKTTEWKDTEIGRIPKDWEVKPIGEIFTFKNGLNKGKEFFGEGTPIINYTDVYHKRSLVAKDIKGKVTLSSDEIKRFEVKKGDMFFTRTSETPEEVGIASVLLEDIPSCVFSGFVLRARPINDSLFPDYCGYGFSTKQIRKDIVNNCTFTTRALTNGQVLSSIKIPLLPISEQQRIANALSDIDMLITSLDKAIEKKRMVKQGAMQQLLTGKKRLKGFTGEWQEVKLDDIVDIEKGDQINATYFVTGGKYPVMNGGATLSGYINKCNRGGDTIIISEGGNSCGYVNVMRRPFWCGGHCYSLKSKIKIDKEYLYQLLKVHEPQLMKLREGTGLPNIQRRSIKEFKLFMSSNLKEQSTISIILMRLDGEISSLTHEREKYLRLKDGMMQELLTGKTRLI